MKKYIIICLMCIAISNLFAQSGGNQENYIPNFTPPSPEASSLGKYAEHPIGYFTGIPDINIPLFEINSERINVPISLNYHASGIKVDQIASRMGLGWTLNAGGAITKTAAGAQDDLDILSGGIKYLGYFNTPASYDGTSTDPEGDSYDLEPDPHFYNIPGHSGKFFIERNKTDYILTNKENIKINSPYDGGFFEIITDDGLIYRFEATEQTTSSSSCSQIIGVYVSSWYLTEIEDQISKKKVTFTYEDLGQIIVDSSTRNQTYAGNSCFPWNPVGSCSTFMTNVGVKRLTRIDYDNGYITFEANHNRQDLINDKAFTAIKKYNNEGDLEKGYSFGTSYYNIAGNTTDKAKRLYLNSISEVPSSGPAEVRYSFDYKTPHLLPPRDSKEQDIWGYFNDNNETSFDPAIYLNAGNFSKTRYSVFGTGTPYKTGANRQSNINTIDIGTLNKITYPTGGYTIFDYEPHQFGGITGGGIRISNKIDYESNATQLMKTAYTYINGKIPGAIPQAAVPSGSGIMTFHQNRSYLGANSGGYIGYDLVIETNVDQNGNTTGAILYEYSNDPDIQSTFIINDDCNNMSTYSYYPFFQWQSNEVKRGTLTKETYYKDGYDQGTFPTKVIDYNYKHIVHESKTVKMGAASSGSGGGIKLTANRTINSEKMLLTSRVESEYDDTGNEFKKITWYTYNDFYEPEPGQIDEDHNLALRTRTESTGQGYSIKTEYKYPYDFAATASGGVMGDMVDMHYVSPVIQELVWKVESSTSLLSSKITDYANFGTTLTPYILPKTVYATSLTSPLSSFSSVTDPASPGTLFEERMEFLEYSSYQPTLIKYDDHYQRLTWNGSSKLSSSQIIPATNTYTFTRPPQGWNEVTSSTSKTGNEIYQYNLSSSFPNLYMGQQGIYYVSFWAKGGFWSLGGSESGNSSGTAPANWTRYSKVFKAEDGWEGTLLMSGSADVDELRISDKPVQITTYHYDKFHRLTDIVDPANNVTYYEYDGFGRLINTKDVNQDIVQANTYHFK